MINTMKNEMKNKRRSNEEGHMAQLIRRKMIQKSKPSGKVYQRKNVDKLIKNNWF